MRLTNKVILVTGVGRGMGNATAKLLVQEGARVVIAARKADLIEPLAEELNAKHNGAVLAVVADATQPQQLTGAVAKATNTFGHLDAFISFPGGGFRHTQDLPEMEDEFFQSTWRNNILSLYYGCRAVIPALKQNGGAIVTVSAGYKTRRDGNIAYGTAKEGMIGFTRNLAREMQPHNIRVNCLCPGLIRLPLSAGEIKLPQATLARRGQPEDVAYAALYFVSDEARWVTGQTLAIDGGDEILAGQERRFD